MHVSPSQIATWRGCQRKWAYSRIRPRSQNKYAAFGTNMHAILEGWLRDHKLPTDDSPERRAALAGLAHLPMPKTPGMSVEQEVRISFEGVDYLGYADAVHWSSPNLAIIDHKSTGNFKWAKTPDELKDDPQWITYGTWGTLQYPETERVFGRWLYYRRQPPGVHPVDIVSTAQDLQERFVAMHRSDGLAIAQAHGRPVEDFPRSLDYCHKFGRCEYMAECHQGVSPIDIAAAALKGREMPTLMEHLTRPAFDEAQYGNLIANPPPGLDVDQLIRHFQLTGAEIRALVEKYGKAPEAPAPEPEPAAAPAGVGPEALARMLGDAPPATEPAPRTRKPRSDAGKPRGPRAAKAVESVHAPNIVDTSEDERALKVGRLVLALLDEVRA